jgi:hypothetical protein
MIPLCDFCAACFASAQRAAFFKKTWSTCAMNCAVYATAAKQRIVCRIYNSIYCLSGDISLYDRDASRHDYFLLMNN